MIESDTWTIAPPDISEGSEDLAQALAIRKEAGIKAYLAAPNPQDEETIRAAFEKDESDILILIRGEVYQALCLKIGEEVVGMCVWDEMKKDRIELHFLYIAPGEQKKGKGETMGYGSLLLDAALKKSMSDDKDVYLITHSAEDFYKEKFGFELTGKKTTDPGGIDVEMKLQAVKRERAFRT